MLCTGDGCCVDEQYRTCVQGNWRQPQQQQFQPVTDGHAECPKPSTAARKSKSAARPNSNCHPLPERVVSAAEHLFALGSAQTTTSCGKPRSGLAICRSNSRDSGLGKDSDNGCSTGSSVPTAGQSSNVLPTTRDFRYVEGFHSPSRHSTSQSTSQPASDNLICTVLPMRNLHYPAARQSNTVSRYPTTIQTVQRASAQHYFDNSGEAEHPRMMSLPPGTGPAKFTDIGGRDGGKQYCGQQFPVVSHSTPPSYYADMVVNPSAHRNRHRRMEVESAGQSSQYRDGMSGHSVGYSVSGVSGSDCAGRLVPASTAADRLDLACMAGHCHYPIRGSRRGSSVFDIVREHHVRSGQPVLVDDLLYPEHHAVDRSHQPPVDLYHNNVDAGHCQQRYQPYTITVDARRGNSAVPYGGDGRNTFYHTSLRHGLMHF